MLKYLRLDFLPLNVDLGLLVLRLWLGISMLWLHGMMKIQGFSKMASGFPDYFGLGGKASLSMAIFAEVICAALLAIGLFTRLSALMLAITMGVAFFLAHKAALSGPGSGEMAFIYLAGFVTLFLTGGGRYSLDGKGKGGG
ncbi:MAG: DoxX family protein, partial [Verrucomicrobiales bacterium]